MSEPTPRDLEIFAAVCRLGSQKAAAFELRIRQDVVKRHLSVLYRKLNVTCQSEAEIALGWLTVPRLGG